MANKKKPTSAKRNSPAKKTAANSGARKNTNNGKMLINNEQSLKTKRQIGAIVLFASAIFILCLALIPGGSFWGFLQDVLFGLFGFCAFVWPLVLFYIAIMASMDKPMVNLKYKIIEATVLIFFICGAIHIFSSEKITTDLLEGISNAYNNGMGTTNGGAIGALIGGILLFSGKTPAGVMICILIFIALMILTGTTLIKLFKSLWNPVKKAGEYTTEQMERTARAREERAEERALEKAKFNPDIDLGPDASESKDIFQEEQEKISKIRKKKQPVEKVDELLPVERTLNSDNDIKSSVQLDDIIKKAANPAPAVQSGINLNDYFSTKEPNTVQNYKLPPIDCLNVKKVSSASNYNDELKTNSQRLVDTLKSFGVETKIVDISRGPSVTRYELQPAAGVKISRITGLSDDIALNLAASGVRIEAPIPNKAAVGIEVPNKSRAIVTLRELIEDSQYINAKSKLTVALGKDIAGNNICTDLAKMPHLLIAGTTGSGKSVCLNSMILSVLFNATPDEVKLVMIDPKQVEFTIYNGIPHLLIPVVSDPRKASGALSWAVTEMLNRYKTFSEHSVRDIYGYNELCRKNSELQKMPQILIFIDELSDLMMAAPNEVEDSICRLAQMARAAGMHLVIATQRPSVDVITGIIKANIPSRIALSVSSQVDSRTIIDMVGAEKLLGNGDMLFYPVGIAKPIRVQGCFITDKEVENVVDFLKSQEQTEYDEEVVKEIERQAASVATKKKGSIISDGEGSDGDSDELLPKAIEVVVESQAASTTLIQRKLKVGYARAARIIDELEERGIVGPFEGSKPRKVLLTKQQWFEMNAMSPDIASANGE